MTPDSGFNFSRLNKKYAFENSTYFDVIHKINSQLSMRYGIRFNQFLRLRQNGLQQYANDDPLYYDNDLKIYDPATPLAGNFDNNSSVFKTYNNIEPRINVSYTINNQSNLTLRKTQNSPYGGDYYLINNGAIQTNFDSGKLKIHYSAYPTDSDGYPMVPDNVYVKQALEWYILRQMLMGGFKHPEFNWQFADAKWGQYCVSAGNDLAYPSIDKVEEIKNMWCRLIPSINHHRDFFMASQTQEQILK